MNTASRMMLPSRVSGAIFGLIIGMSPMAASADLLTMTWNGLFTMLTPNGAPIINSSDPYYSDPTWGYGSRTPIGGTMTLDTVTGAGSATIAPFEWLGVPEFPMTISGIQLQTIGNGMGAAGPLVLGNMLFDWNGNSAVPVSMVWDASGLLSALAAGPISYGSTITGVGVYGASEGVGKGSVPMGLLPLATTTWNTTAMPGVTFGMNPGGTLPLVSDGSLVTDYDTNPLLAGWQQCADMNAALVGNQCALGVSGSPMPIGPFSGYNANIDFTTVTLSLVCPAGGTCCYEGVCPPPVPVPAAVWLLGSGLLGLGAASFRRRSGSRIPV